MGTLVLLNGYNNYSFIFNTEIFQMHRHESVHKTRIKHSLLYHAGIRIILSNQ